MRSAQVSWPKKCDLFGVGISATHYDEAEEQIMRAAFHRQSALVTALAVHGLMTAVGDYQQRERINAFDLVAPDGQPVRWALNKFHRASLGDRVYGPELMLRLCRRAAAQGVSIYLHASKPHVIAPLTDNLARICPGLKIAGVEAIANYPLSPQQTDEFIDRVNASGAGLLFLGLGCPRQEQFAHEIGDRVRAAVICVGAAFDFHAGTKKMAPRWMQRCGLEWLFRLLCEPRRLWRRYLVTNTNFLLRVAGRMLGR
jgi:N-acetylglucosaminyldiphosphoundecaprenol N-acetyl-beta-D-mannosaminyltransferase